MASIYALTNRLAPEGSALSQPRLVALRTASTASTARAAAQEAYYIEDGWVFREHHGKYVECICRTEDISSAPIPILPVLQHR